MARPPRRPNPVQWIGYAFGATLPEQLRPWVRRDLLGPHAAARHLVRGMVPFVPIFVVFLVIPGPWPLRVAMVALGLILALIYSAAYMVQNRRHRLEKNGLDPDARPDGVERAKARDRREYEAVYGTDRPIDHPAIDRGGPKERGGK